MKRVSGVAAVPRARAAEAAYLALLCVQESIDIGRIIGWGEDTRALPGLLREVFGNPFCRRGADLGWLSRCNAPRQVAGAIYADRCFSQLPILADALEDVGCTEVAILEHLRSPGPHVRGCWALDLILGKQ